MLRCFEDWFGPFPWYADGFKVDFTQRAPSGTMLRSGAGSDGVWGVAALHLLIVEDIHWADDGMLEVTRRLAALGHSTTALTLPGQGDGDPSASLRGRPIGERSSFVGSASVPRNRLWL